MLYRDVEVVYSGTKQVGNVIEMNKAYKAMLSKARSI